MSKKWFLVLPVILMGTLLIASCASQQFYDNSVSDQEYVSIASNTPEARAFLEKYPRAEVIVDRSGKLAVDWRVTQRPVVSTTLRWEGIRLRVFIDPSTRRPAGTFIQCNDKFVNDEVIRYLERYFETSSCPSE